MSRRERQATADAILAALKESRLRRAAGDHDGATAMFMRARRQLARLDRDEQRRIVAVDAHREAKEIAAAN